MGPYVDPLRRPWAQGPGGQARIRLKSGKKTVFGFLPQGNKDTRPLFVASGHCSWPPGPSRPILEDCSWPPGPSWKTVRGPSRSRSVPVHPRGLPRPSRGLPRPPEACRRPPGGRPGVGSGSGRTTFSENARDAFPGLPRALGALGGPWGGPGGPMGALGPMGPYGPHGALRGPTPWGPIGPWAPREAPVQRIIQVQCLEPCALQEYAAQSALCGFSALFEVGRDQT